MPAAELSEVLRNGEGLFLACRRGIVITSFVAMGCMVIVGLYQMGLIGHVPDPPLPMMNSNKVDSAPEAYNRVGLRMPDAFVGLISYAVTAALASSGGALRSQDWWRWAVFALAAKVLIDAFQAGKLSYEQWHVHQAFCFWCLLAALATFLAVPLVLPETIAALKRLFG